MGEQSRTGWTYRNRASDLLWVVVEPLHLVHWRLERVTGTARIVRSNAELDNPANWELAFVASEGSETPR